MSHIKLDVLFVPEQCLSHELPKHLLTALTGTSLCRWAAAHPLLHRYIRGVWGAVTPGNTNLLDVREWTALESRQQSSAVPQLRNELRSICSRLHDHVDPLEKEVHVLVGVLEKRSGFPEVFVWPNVSEFTLHTDSTPT